MGLLKSVAKQAVMAAAVMVGKRIASSLASRLRQQLAKNRPPRQ